MPESATKIEIGDVEVTIRTAEPFRGFFSPYDSGQIVLFHRQEFCAETFWRYPAEFVGPNGPLALTLRTGLLQVLGAESLNNPKTFARMLVHGTRRKGWGPEAFDPAAWTPLVHRWLSGATASHAVRVLGGYGQKSGLPQVLDLAFAYLLRIGFFSEVLALTDPAPDPEDTALRAPTDGSAPTPAYRRALLSELTMVLARSIDERRPQSKRGQAEAFRRTLINAARELPVGPPRTDDFTASDQASCPRALAQALFCRALAPAVLEQITTTRTAIKLLLTAPVAGMAPPPSLLQVLTQTPEGGVAPGWLLGGNPPNPMGAMSLYADSWIRLREFDRVFDRVAARVLSKPSQHKTEAIQAIADAMRRGVYWKESALALLARDCGTQTNKNLARAFQSLHSAACAWAPSTPEMAQLRSHALRAALRHFAAHDAQRGQTLQLELETQPAGDLSGIDGPLILHALPGAIQVAPEAVLKHPQLANALVGLLDSAQPAVRRLLRHRDGDPRPFFHAAYAAGLDEFLTLINLASDCRREQEISEILVEVAASKGRPDALLRVLDATKAPEPQMLTRTRMAWAATDLGGFLAYAPEHLDCAEPSVLLRSPDRAAHVRRFWSSATDGARLRFTDRIIKHADSLRHCDEIRPILAVLCDTDAEIASIWARYAQLAFQENQALKLLDLIASTLTSGAFTALAAAIQASAQAPGPKVHRRIIDIIEIGIRSGVDLGAVGACITAAADQAGDDLQPEEQRRLLLALLAAGAVIQPIGGWELVLSVVAGPRQPFQHADLPNLIARFTDAPELVLAVFAKFSFGRAMANKLKAQKHAQFSPKRLLVLLDPGRAPQQATDLALSEQLVRLRDAEVDEAIAFRELIASKRPKQRKLALKTYDAALTRNGPGDRSALISLAPIRVSANQPLSDSARSGAAELLLSNFGTIVQGAGLEWQNAKALLEMSGAAKKTKAQVAKAFWTFLAERHDTVDRRLFVIAKLVLGPEALAEAVLAILPERLETLTLTQAKCLALVAPRLPKGPARWLKTGLADPEAVRRMTSTAPDVVRELLRCVNAEATPSIGPCLTGVLGALVDPSRSAALASQGPQLLLAVGGLAQNQSLPYDLAVASLLHMNASQGSDFLRGIRALQFKRSGKLSTRSEWFGFFPSTAKRLEVLGTLLDAGFAVCDFGPFHDPKNRTGGLFASFTAAAYALMSEDCTFAEKQAAVELLAKVLDWTTRPGHEANAYGIHQANPLLVFLGAQMDLSSVGHKVDVNDVVLATSRLLLQTAADSTHPLQTRCRELLHRTCQTAWTSETQRCLVGIDQWFDTELDANPETTEMVVRSIIPPLSRLLDVEEDPTVEDWAVLCQRVPNLAAFVGVERIRKFRMASMALLKNLVAQSRSPRRAISFLASVYQCAAESDFEWVQSNQLILGASDLILTYPDESQALKDALRQRYDRPALDADPERGVELAYCLDTLPIASDEHLEAVLATMPNRIAQIDEILTGRPSRVVIIQLLASCFALALQRGCQPGVSDDVRRLLIDLLLDRASGMLSDVLDEGGINRWRRILESTNPS